MRKCIGQSINQSIKNFLCTTEELIWALSQTLKRSHLCCNPFITDTHHLWLCSQTEGRDTVITDRATSSDRLRLSQKQTERLMSQCRNKALQEHMHEKESVSERGGLERDWRVIKMRLSAHRSLENGPLHTLHFPRQTRRRSGTKTL